MKHIDLNADLGEGAGTDEALMSIISSANIACGGHAGNDDTMRTALRLAKANDVVCGAHPGFADKENFGRRRLDLRPNTLAEMLLEQLEALSVIAGHEGVRLGYVKLHGALANMAAEDPDVALTAFAAVKAHDEAMSVLAIDNSAQVQAANELGLSVIREAYADRGYTRKGLLIPRTEPGAVLTDPDAVAAQCLRLALAGEILTAEGRVIRSEARSICLHGDTEGAVELARTVRAALSDAGVLIAAAA